MSGHSPHCILRQALSLTMELPDPASVAGQLAQGILRLCLLREGSTGQPPCPPYLYMGAEDAHSKLLLH